MLELIGHASALFAREPSLLEISGEAKLYGDLHGMRLEQREIARFGVAIVIQYVHFLACRLIIPTQELFLNNNRTNARLASSAARLWRAE